MSASPKSVMDTRNKANLINMSEVFGGGKKKKTNIIGKEKRKEDQKPVTYLRKSCDDLELLAT